MDGERVVGGAASRTVHGGWALGAARTHAEWVNHRKGVHGSWRLGVGGVCCDLPVARVESLRMGPDREVITVIFLPCEMCTALMA